jgi:hypothetical protein
LEGEARLTCRAVERWNRNSVGDLAHSGMNLLFTRQGTGSRGTDRAAYALVPKHATPRSVLLGCT